MKNRYLSTFLFYKSSKVNYELQTAVAPQEKIVRVISLLTKDFVHSRNSNHRKGTHSSPFIILPPHSFILFNCSMFYISGGLIGLAASAIGLHSCIDLYLTLILPPIISSFDDQVNSLQSPTISIFICLFNHLSFSTSSLFNLSFPP